MHYLQKAHLSSDTKLIDLADINIYDASVQTDERNLSPVHEKTVLDPEDDAAHAKLGGSWYMPTSEDFKELQDNCDVEWTTLNGVFGRRFTSRKNGNRIFLPAAGYRTADNSSSVGSDGSYWSSTLHTEAPDHAYYFSFGSDEVRADNSYRFYGRSVSPIYIVNVTGVSLNTVWGLDFYLNGRKRPEFYISLCLRYETD